ncbi:putative short-chain dehydrogenase/reductase [Podospora appendiculata]|uniref:Short-chain dehydrogenase/reductase n=1 Tax=Podospora appendiculata TaxID=314037 RepID=A0AAE0X6E5_9PEZI|nr:putative short-chain dehydrogenase/reductase [Podospora appendiculata]
MTKRTVLITGCSEGGIGWAIAKAYHARGYHVFATLRSPAKAGSGLAGLSDVDILPLEVTSDESIRQCAAEVGARTGGSLDVLVNNAGADFVMPLLDTSVTEAKKLYDVNVWAVLAVTQAFAPLLIKAHGAVLNIASVAGVLEMAWSGIYNSSKAAEVTISETLRLELAPLGVRVLTAMVGAVQTPIHENAGELKLPETSYYQAARKIISDQRAGVLKTNCEAVDVTARNLVQDVESGRSGQVWRGGMAYTVRNLVWLLPRAILDRAANGMRGLELVKAAWAGK